MANGLKKKKVATNKDPQLILLQSGVRLVHLREAGAGLGVFGMAIRAGSADERPGEFGLAHLVEHTIFKGTARRTSWNIINRMESVGGELNAYTTKEETVVYSIFPTGNASRAVELIADLACNSAFPEKQIEKEREVVVDEIMSYFDTPSEAIFDDFEDQIYAGSPLGHNILGYPETVSGLTSGDCRAFLRDFYTKDNIVVFYAGNLSASTVGRMVDRHFAPLGECCSRRTAGNSPAKPFVLNVQKPIHQAHVVRGIATGGIYCPERYAVGLFANLTGGPGMNSLLNVELRERRGLVYNVETSTAMYTSGGLVTVYYGCDPEDVEQCGTLCDRTFARIADGGLTPRRLEMAKRQYIGQLAIAAENMENTIMAAARATLFRGEPTAQSATIDGIMAVGRGDIIALAEAATNPSVLTFLP